MWQITDLEENNFNLYPIIVAWQNQYVSVHNEFIPPPNIMINIWRLDANVFAMNTAEGRVQL